MEKSFNNHLLSISWLFFLLFPNNNIFFVLVPIVYLLLFDNQKKIDKLTFNYILLIVMLMIVSFKLNINELYLNLKSVARVTVLILMFFSFGRLKGNKILAPYIIIAVLFLVTSQFSGILNFSKINSLIDRFYKGGEGDSVIDINSSFEMVYYGVQRLGGIYFNANNYAGYLELILAVLLCEIKQFSKVSLFILIPLIVFSLIATGSRTSLIVLIIMALFFLYSSKIISVKKVTIISFLTILTSTIIFFNDFRNFRNFRIFKVNEGLDNSFGVKIEILNTYLTSNPPIKKLLFGNFSGAAIRKYTGISFIGTDFEIGNLIVYFGFIFFSVVLLFYISLFKKILPKYRVVFTILLWMFSNSILLSFRMAAIWILVLGHYYHRSIKEKQLNER